MKGLKVLNTYKQDILRRSIQLVRGSLPLNAQVPDTGTIVVRNTS